MSSIIKIKTKNGHDSLVNVGYIVALQRVGNTLNVLLKGCNQPMVIEMETKDDTDKVFEDLVSKMEEKHVISAPLEKKVLKGPGNLSVTVKNQEWRSLRNLVNANKKIAAIKDLRELKGLGLKDAKDIIEQNFHC